ncbi:hypothetical protein D9M69_544400 [compost metagenome]
MVITGVVSHRNLKQIPYDAEQTHYSVDDRLNDRDNGIHNSSNDGYKSIDDRLYDFHYNTSSNIAPACRTSRITLP